MRYTIEFDNHRKKDFEDVFKIEQDYLEPSTIASIEQVLFWDKKNPDAHIFVRDKLEDKIVGEITLMPITKTQYKKFMVNEFSDTDLPNTDIHNYENLKSCILLFSAIAIDKNYRQDRKVLSCLLHGFYEKIKILKNRGVRFENMCAEGQTADGQKFIENFLNMTCKFITKDNYKLYSFDNSEEFDDWFNRFPSYIENYDRKFGLAKI